MATVITDLTDSITSRIQAFLGTDYSELSNMTILENNNFRGANKRYGINAKQAVEVDGTLKHLTVDQVFELTFTDGFSSNSQSTDVDKRNKTIALQNLIVEAYRDLKINKAGRADIVIIVQSLDVSEPVFLEDDHVVALPFELTIKYRTQL